MNAILLHLSKYICLGASADLSAGIFRIAFLFVILYRAGKYYPTPNIAKKKFECGMCLLAIAVISLNFWLILFLLREKLNNPEGIADPCGSA